MDSNNFDIAIGQQIGNLFPITARYEPLGSESDQRVIEPDRPPLQPLLEWAESAVGARSASLARVEKLGQALFDALFGGRLGRFLRAALQDAEQAGRPLRLRLSADDPAILALPWEFMLDGQSARLFATDPSTPLVRYLSQYPAFGRPRHLEASLPLRLLMVVPAVADLDVKTEIERVRQALNAEDLAGKLIQMTVLGGPDQPVTLQALLDRLQEAEQGFDILHFVGHGTLDGGRGYLRFNQEGGGDDWVVDSVLARSLKPYVEDGLRLVVLNSCESAAGYVGPSSVLSFVGVAPALIQAGLAAVVAMQYPLLDQAALLFARAFYRGLTRGRTAGLVDLAVTEARNRLDAQFQGHRSFATPVLFLHAADGRIFKLETTAGASHAGRQPTPGQPSEAPPRLLTRQDQEQEAHYLLQQLRIQRANLGELELQRAQFGARVPLDLVNDIRRVEEEIARLEQRLAALPEDVVRAARAVLASTG